MAKFIDQGSVMRKANITMQVMFVDEKMAAKQRPSSTSNILSLKSIEYFFGTEFYDHSIIPYKNV